MTKKQFNRSKRYTEQEMEVIREMVEKYPLNFETAFREAAKQINRAPNAIAQKWYKSMSQNTHTMVATITKTSITRNRKQGQYNVSNPRLDAALTIFNKLDKDEKIALLQQLPEDERFSIISELF